MTNKTRVEFFKLNWPHGRQQKPVKRIYSKWVTERDWKPVFVFPLKQEPVG